MSTRWDYSIQTAATNWRRLGTTLISYMLYTITESLVRYFLNIPHKKCKPFEEMQLPWNVLLYSINKRRRLNILRIWIFPVCHHQNPVMQFWIDKIVVLNAKMDSSHSNTYIATRLCNFKFHIYNSIKSKMILSGIHV